jgi:hypothetical protein
MRIRTHLTGPLSAQGLMMISLPAQKRTISRRLEPKSFIYKPLERKTRFIALSDGMVTGPFSEGSGASGSLQVIKQLR